VLLCLFFAKSVSADPNIPSAAKRLMDEANWQVDADMNGPRGQHARECSKQLGITA
jgi:hypothetical protein